MKKVKKILATAAMLIIAATNSAMAQKSININKTNISTTLLKNQSTKRSFEINTELQNFSQQNIGDTLVLDFFGNSRYKAIVKQVSKSYSSATGITAQILNTEFGYCFISISEKNIAISVELPQINEYFSTKKENGVIYLQKQKLSEVRQGGECTHSTEAEKQSAQKIPVLKAISPTQPDNPNPVTLNILAAYTPAAKAYTVQNGDDIENLINLSIMRSNLVLSNSQTNVTLNLVHTQEVNYTETSNPNNDLANLRNPEDGLADEVHALRTRYDAALVTLIIGELNSNVLGAGYIPNDDEYGNAKSAFSVVRVKTIPDDYTMIHEIGHNFGCGHHTQTDNISLYSYSHGYKDMTTLGTMFSTIMSYERTGGLYSPRIPYFSDPNMQFEGTAIGSSAANNAKTIRQMKAVLATYAAEAKYVDAFLRDIVISSGTLNPAFNPGEYYYVVNVGNSVEKIDINGIANSQYATVSGGGGNNIPLNLGDNLIEIVVKDGWDNYTKKYTLNIIRADVSGGDGGGSGSAINETAENSDKIILFPNPAVDELRIASEKLVINSIEINDISGKKISADRFQFSPDRVNVSNLSSGIYIVKFITDKGAFVKRFLKK
jgi:hypothetical protein